LQPTTPSSPNLVIYGLTATGKSSITESVLESFQNSTDTQVPIRHAIISSAECITGRHILETAVDRVSNAVGYSKTPPRCESLASLASILKDIMAEYIAGYGDASSAQFVLVFDGIDKQRDAPPTLLPALARLSEQIPYLTVVFIVTSPRPHMLRNPGAPHLHFPPYTKQELITILGRNPLQLYPDGHPALISHEEDETNARQRDAAIKDLYTKFLSALYDTSGRHVSRSLTSLKHLAQTIWPRFTKPILAGTCQIHEFQKLLLSQRFLLRDESLLVPKITSTIEDNTDTTSANGLTKPGAPAPPPSVLALLNKRPLAPPLPSTSRLLLVAAYLCSHTPARLDSQLFSRANNAAKKRRRKALTAGVRASKPGVEKKRKLNRKLLGPQAWVVERCLAVYHALRQESNLPKTGLGGRGGGLSQGGLRLDRAGNLETAGHVDVLSALATLASLRLVVKTSASADPLEGGCKWKVNVGWEVVRGVGRGVGIEVGEWIVD
jgi:origin recognition complex subunit 5